MLTTTVRKWEPPGPVALMSWASDAEVVALQGPVGSGKTGTFVQKAQRLVQRQNKWPDGVRRARLCILRDDYRKLWENFIPAWWEWVPKELQDREGRKVIEWVGSHGGPAVQTWRTIVRDPSSATGFTICELETHFLALGDNQNEQALEAFFGGLAFTAYWLNEAHTMNRVVFEYCIQRKGRFPHERDAVPVAPAVWMDFNAPVEGHFLYDLITGADPKVKLVQGTHYFRQPGGLDANAENQKGHPRPRYESMMRWMRPHEIDRKVHNKFGRKRDGEPVYRYFDDEKMVAPEALEPDPSRRLIVSLDAGLSPAAVLSQRMADGQRRALDEVVSEHGVGPERFGRRLRQMLDQPKYARFRSGGNIRVVADPAAFGGVDKVAKDKSWAQRVGAEIGLTIHRARSNAIGVRHQSIEDCHVTIEGVPMYYMSPTCVVLRRANNGGYRWRKIRFAGEERLSDEVDDNEFTHVADADQYGAMEEGGYETAIGRPHVDDDNPVVERMVAAGYSAPQTLGGGIKSARRARLESRERERGGARQALITGEE